MQRICDLHTHSTFSDGDHTPTQLVEAAVAQGLSAIALSDHNTVEGLPELLRAARGKDILPVCGAEFSVDYNGTELHLLGLFIPERAFAEVTEEMRQVRQRKENSNLQLIESLKNEGIFIDYEQIKGRTPNGNVNRSHIAAELIRQGRVASKEEAFAGLLSETGGHYRPYQRITLWEMLERLRSIHAAPVLAHPFKELSDQELTALLPLAKERGLMGLECLHSDYNAQQKCRSLELAERFDLCCSGGSDFHGKEKKGIALGSGRGNLQVPYHWAELLRDTLAKTV